MSKLSYVFSGSGSGRPYCRENVAHCRTKDNVCVVMDGCEVVYASETERVTKIKHDFALPLENFRRFKANSPFAEGAEFEQINIDDAPTNHHECHIYEAFYMSGFKDAAVLVVDGYGNLEDCITLAYMQEGEEPIILKKFSRHDSACHVYGHTSRCVFKHEMTQGKLMGLAAYGKYAGKDYIRWDDVTKTVKIAGDEEILDDVNECMKGTQDVMLAKDIAFTVQKNFEETMLEVVKHFKELLDEKWIKTENLCLSGGGILNCPTNSKIIDLGYFKHYYGSPQPSDGCANSVGAAFRNMQFRGEKLTSTRLQTPYLGVTYPRSELFNPSDRIRNPNETLAEMLINGEVLAWYQGGAEWGPRALGHRSFLADPSKPGMWEALNTIKGRECWRPFAPIVPDRLFRLIFDDVNTDMCEYMLRTLPIKKKWQEKLKAVCHVDGTTRPQILKREMNPQLYDLMMIYFEQTGIPCLVNTSLNINGFPIVESPADFCFLYDEVEAIPEIPPVNAIFVDKTNFFKVRRLEYF